MVVGDHVDDDESVFAAMGGGTGMPREGARRQGIVRPWGGAGETMRLGPKTVKTRLDHLH